MVLQAVTLVCNCAYLHSKQHCRAMRLIPSNTSCTPTRTPHNCQRPPCSHHSSKSWQRDAQSCAAATQKNAVVMKAATDSKRTSRAGHVDRSMPATGLAQVVAAVKWLLYRKKSKLLPKSQPPHTSTPLSFFPPASKAPPNQDPGTTQRHNCNCAARKKGTAAIPNQPNTQAPKLLAIPAANTLACRPAQAHQPES